MARRKYQFADRAEAEAEYDKVKWRLGAAENFLEDLIKLHAVGLAPQWIVKGNFSAIVRNPARADGSGGELLFREFSQAPQDKGKGTGQIFCTVYVTEVFIAWAKKSTVDDLRRLGYEVEDWVRREQRKEWRS